MSFIITKASGKQEEFNANKVRRSLIKAKVDSKTIDQILQEVIEKRLPTTQEIHEYISKRLTEINPPLAARYNLKRALIEFGPAGYPFEQYIARLLELEGYRTETEQIIAGACVNHEVDVVAQKNETVYMIECKFHNAVGLKTDVKVTLYIQARFEDINKSSVEKKQTQYIFYPWIFSNTHFTSEAVTYARCVGLKITGWSYPEGESLADLIEKHGLHPITALTSLSHRQKKQLLDDGIILCRDLQSYKKQLAQYHLKPHEIEQALKEAENVCFIE